MSENSASSGNVKPSSDESSRGSYITTFVVNRDVGFQIPSKPVNDSEKGIEKSLPQKCEKSGGAEDTEQGKHKVKLKRLSDSEHDVDKNREYFRSEDFKKLGDHVTVINVPGTKVSNYVSKDDVTATANATGEDASKDIGKEDVVHMEEEEDEHGEASDSDVSTSSECDAGGRYYSGRRTGSYDFIDTVGDDDGNDDKEGGGRRDGKDDDCVSVELEDGDSEFDSDQECSSISVSGSEEEEEDDHSEDEGDKLPPSDHVNTNGASVTSVQTPYTRSTLSDGLKTSDKAIDAESAGDSTKMYVDENREDASDEQRDVHAADKSSSSDTQTKLGDTNSKPVSSAESDTSPSQPTNKRPILLFDPSQAPGAKKKRAMTAQVIGQEETDKGPLISPDTVHGYSLNHSWVDRVNKVLAEYSHNRKVSASNDDLIRHAKECKIMKRYSDKCLSPTQRPRFVKENLRRSPSDARHDRTNNYNTRGANGTDTCSCRLFPESSRGYLNRNRNASYMKACTGEGLRPVQQAEPETVPQKTVKLTDRQRESKVPDTSLSEYITKSHHHGNLIWMKRDSSSSNQSPTNDKKVPLTRPRPFGKSGERNTPGNSAVHGKMDNATMDNAAMDNKEQPLHMDYTDGSGVSSPVDEDMDNEDHESHGVYMEKEEEEEEGHSHMLMRKPAVRRKGYSWINRTYPKNTASELRKQKHNRGVLTHNQGSSVELAPSLLNLYDHRIATNAEEDEEDDHVDDHISSNQRVTKTQSLPSNAEDDTVTLRYGRLPSQCLPLDRPVSLMEADPAQPRRSEAAADTKKRPLSISSMSSASTSSLPRMRKRRANSSKGAEGETSRDDSQTSDCTLVPERGSGNGSSESRHSVDSGCIDSDRNGDRFLDNMSITSSDTGSFRDEVDSSSFKDFSAMSSSPSEKPHEVHMSQTSVRPNYASGGFPSPESKSSRNIRTVSSSVPIPHTSTPQRQSLRTSRDTGNDSGMHGDKSSTCYTPPSPTIKLPSSERHRKDCDLSPDSYRRSSSSSLRYEARKKFFDHYEEHINSSPTSPLSPQDFESLSPSHSSKRNGIYVDKHFVPTSSTVIDDRASVSPPSSPHYPSSSIDTAATTAGRHREGSSQFSPNSEKASRKSERRGSSSRHDGQPFSPSSQRSMFSRTSKKRDAMTSGDPGNRGSPVYVSYVQRVVTEIIDSERVYIGSLKEIIEGYLEPLEKILNTEAAEKDLKCLFSNIRDIYKFGCTFLADLEKCAEPVKVAECFVRHNKGFVIYADYCTNYPRAVEVLTQFMQDPQLSELCRERQYALGHGLPLGAFLLKPVQRILKYHLLLQNIVKNSEKDGKEAKILEQAFHHMTEMAHHINEMKRKHEHAVRIQEIQSLLEDYVGEDLTRLGELVLESTFRVYGAKASRQVFLFERGLLISKKKEGGMHSFKTFIRCSNLMLVEVIPNEPLSFHVIPFNSPRDQYTLQARNMEQKKRWCQEMKRLIVESFKGKIPDSVKNLIMQLGTEHDDDYVPKEALDAVRKNQHTAPEYLEKRRVRRKSGSRMPDFSLLKPQRAKRGANKKNENRLGEKSSPEMGRRAASKSPEFHRRLFSRQNAMAKRRSQSTSNSLPTTPVTDLPHSEMFGQAYTNSRSATSPPVTPEAKQTSTPSSSPSKDSKSPTPVLRKSPRRKFSESSNAQEGSENDSEGLKRPVSFLMARARPINSDDLGELVVRCGGSIKMQKGQDTMQEESKACTLPTNLQDISGCSLSSLRSRSDMDDSSDDEDDDEETLADEDRSNTTEDMITETTDNTEPHVPVVSDDAQMSTENVRSHVENNMNKRTKELTRRGSRSSSLPVLNKPVAGEKDTTNATEAKKKKKSQSSENMLDSDKVPKPRGRMSRRDMQNATYANGHHSRKETDSKENVSDHGKDDRKVTAFHDSYGKRGDKVVLRKKGLRLPNTSKHLSEQNFQSSPQTSAAKAKLTNWNSVDKLTKGSMNDVSHLEENPWVKNPDSAEKNSNREEESEKDESFKTRHSPTPMRPRGHSDVTDMMQVSSEKEKLDWMVYLNRNSLMPPGANAKPPLSGNRVSSPLLDRRTGGKGYLDLKLSTSSQHPFATPPRAYMTAENMKKYGSSKDSTAQGPWPGYHELSGRAASSNTLPTSSNTFGVPPMNITVTKPVSFDKHNLPRWNSTPISGEGGAATKAASKGRPASMDFEKLADESNRMVAEMEEYINKVSSDESIKSPSKFPTSLPTITVEEEEADSNRLSIVSSLSTSSYESQGSSSSDGLVGTLKHKLHAWSHRPDGRHDSEQSHTSTLTSDDEDKEEESVHSFSGNTYEPPSKDRTTWKEERELETVLREHGLGSSSLGSRMAHSVLVEPVPTHSSDNSNPNARPHSSCGLSAPDKHTDAAGQVPSMIDSQPDQARFSLPASTEATEALMPAAIKNLEIQQSDSGFSLQSNDSCLSDQAQMVTETEPVPNAEHKSSTKPEPESSTKVELVSNDPSTKSEPESSKASEPVLQDSSTKPELESSKAAEPVMHDSLVKPELKSSKAAEPVSQDSSVKPELESSEAAEVVLRHSSRRSGPASSKEQTTNTTDVSQKSKTADPPTGAASHKRHTSSDSIASVDSFYERKLSIAFDSEVFDDKAAVVSVYDDPPPKEQSEAPAPRKSIREYVHDLEKKLRAPSPKVFEVRRREPGAIIRQRMENLQESILNSRRSSSRSSSRPVSEERDMTRSRSSPPAHHRWTYAGNRGSTSNENVKFPVMKFSNSRDSLSKSVENLPLSRENMFLSRSRESLHSNSDYPTKPMLSTYTEKSHNAGQEKEASRFQLMSSGNQFIHRTRRNSDHARPECERAPTPDQESVVAIQGSRSMCRLDELNSEVDNLVIMKGWVKALISKFQEKT